MDLAGRTALVTGGAVRLGRAIAHGLAESGANIVLHYHSSQTEAESARKEIASLGVTCVLVSADFSHPISAAESIFNRRAQIDVLVNSAAIYESPTLLETDEDTFDRHLTINLKAPFFLSQQFAEQLPAESPGNIVNICDWRAARPPGEQTAYTIAKAGLLALTKSLAIELAPRIRVNAVAPGLILPPPGEGEDYIEQSIEKVPLARKGEPEEIADAVLSLIRNDFVTGEMLHVTGGQQLSGGS